MFECCCQEEQVSGNAAGAGRNKTGGSQAGTVWHLQNVMGVKFWNFFTIFLKILFLFLNSYWSNSKKKKAKYASISHIVQRSKDQPPANTPVCTMYVHIMDKGMNTE